MKMMSTKVILLESKNSNQIRGKKNNKWHMLFLTPLFVSYVERPNTYYLLLVLWSDVNLHNFHHHFNHLTFVATNALFTRIIQKIVH